MKNKKNSIGYVDKYSKIMKDNNESWWKTYTFHGCEHSPIVLPNGFGILTGGHSKTTDNVSLSISLDTHRFNESNVMVDTYGFLRESIRQILFPIQDLGTPSVHRIGQFDNVLSEVYSYLKGGLNVHVNCQGGHGRTGLLLACLLGKYFKALVKDNPVEYLRNTYCKGAVETFPQHKFVSLYTGTRKPKHRDYYTAYADFEYVPKVYNEGNCRLCNTITSDRIFLPGLGLVCQICWQLLSKSAESKDTDTDRYSG